MEMNLKKVGKNFLLKTKPKILIAGTGAQAENFLKVFEKNKIQVDTLCSTKRSSDKAENLKKKYKIKKISSNLDQIIKNNNFDYIFLLISWDQIEKILKRVLKDVNCPLFTEKPVATSLKTFFEINKLANLYKRQIYVLYNRRYYKTIDLLKQKLYKTKNYRFQITIPEQNSRIRKKYGKKIDGKIRYFISSHWVDLVFFLCGNLKVSKINIEKNIQTIFLKNNKIQGSINFIFDAIEKIKFNFYFSNSSYELSPLEKLSEVSKLVKVKNVYNYKKKVIKNISNNKFKPGLDEMIKSIFVKKDFKKYLPEVSDLKNTYNLLAKLKH